MSMLSALQADVDALFIEMENKEELATRSGERYPVGYYWQGEFVQVGLVAIENGVVRGCVYEAPFLTMWNRLEYTRPLKAVWYESPKQVQIRSQVQSQDILSDPTGRRWV